MRTEDKKRFAIEFLVKHAISSFKDDAEVNKFCEDIAKEALPMLADIPHIENRVKAAILLGFAGEVLYEKITEEIQKDREEQLFKDVISGKVKSYCYSVTFKSGKEANIVTNKIIGEDEIREHLSEQDELKDEIIDRVDLVEEKEHKKISKILQKAIL